MGVNKPSRFCLSELILTNIYLFYNLFPGTALSRAQFLFCPLKLYLLMFSFIDVNFPVFKDTDVVTDLHQAIIRPDTQHWRTPSIKTILQFSWSVLLRVLSQFPNLDSLEEIFEEDEELLNVSIESDAFRFLKSGIVAADTFMQEVN